MIARGVALALAVAACGKGHGLVVQTNGSNVELFVAMKSDDCPAGTSCPITPPLASDRNMRGPTRLARRWLISDTVPILDDNGWRFEADGAEDQTIAALLAVETDNQGNVVKFGLAHDVLVPAQGRAILELGLHAPTTSDGVQLWRSQMHGDTEAPCALVATGKQDQPFESFSRPADQDCDKAMPECDKYGVFGSTPASDDGLNCVIEPTPAKCELGGVACMDGMPTGTTCGEPTDPWCLPSAMCVPLATCRQSDNPCFSMMLRMLITAGGPLLHCTYPLGSGVACANPPLQALINLSPIGPMCNEVKVAALANPLNWQSSADLGGTNDTQFSITNFDNNSCTFTANISEPADTSKGAVGLIEVKTKDNPPVHHVIPILVSHEGADCMVQPHCDMIVNSNASDSLYNCR